MHLQGNIQLFMIALSRLLIMKMTQRFNLLMKEMPLNYHQ